MNDNVAYMPNVVESARKQSFLAGAEAGLRFGYIRGYYDCRIHKNNSRLSFGDFAMRCLLVYIVACVLIYMVSVVSVLVLDFSRQDVLQEMVRVHEMREAYWH